MVGWLVGWLVGYLDDRLPRWPSGEASTWSAGDGGPLPAVPSRVMPVTYRLVGLVVKATASRAEDPGFESRLRRDFSGVESYL